MQSTYTAQNTVSDTLMITFTVTNNQKPLAIPDFPVTGTVTDTINFVSAIDFSQDPNTIRNVLLTDDLLPSNATFLSADPNPTHKNNELAWNLGNMSPLESLTVTLHIQIPTSVLTFTNLDTGATAWGTLQGRAVSAATTPASLSPNEFVQ